MRCCICANDCKTSMTNSRKGEGRNMNRKWKKMIWIAPLAILAMVLFAYIGGEIVMHLWNWLLPPLFGWHQITFWQAFRILALCRILFGGHGLHGSGRSNMRRRMKERMDRSEERR